MIPPATAAFDSEEISALCVSPGSRKCTWSSIIPGIKYNPSASIISALFAEIFDAMFLILSFEINTSAIFILPSFTMLACFIRNLFMLSQNYFVALSNLSFMVIPNPSSGNLSAIIISSLHLSKRCNAAYKFEAACFKFFDGERIS